MYGQHDSGVTSRLPTAIDTAVPSEAKHTPAAEGERPSSGVGSCPLFEAAMSSLSGDTVLTDLCKHCYPLHPALVNLGILLSIDHSSVLPKRRGVMARATRESDARNEAFAVNKNLAKHKPGLDLTAEAKDKGTGNHRFQRSDKKDVPRGTLAERIAKSTRGD